MRIKLNGEPHDLAEPMTISQLLAQLGIDGRRVAVEHNLVVLKRATFDQTTIRDGDEIEIVNFVGGGARERSGALGPHERPSLAGQGGPAIEP